jgi:hypothetical protein
MSKTITKDKVSASLERSRLESEYGQVWDTKQLQNDFSIKFFLAPFVEVIRKSDGATGTLRFTHFPRFYYSFKQS